MNKLYTGIGSRSTPEETQDIMTKYAKRLSVYGYTLRSGGAEGADTAFEIGAVRKEIYLPWKDFNNNDSDLYGVCNKALEIAEDIHPNWSACNQAMKKLHARNVYQILGKDIDTPSEFVVYWAEEYNGNVKGGTRTAVELARKHNIPTYNLNILKEHQEFSRLILQKYIKYIRMRLKFYSLFYSDAIEDKDLNRIDILVQIKPDKYTRPQLTSLNNLFNKYYGMEKKQENLPAIDNLKV